MESLPKPERDRALQALGVWCEVELTGTEPPKTLLESLNFSSSEAMRMQLTNWGLPETLVYAKPPKPPREARSGGDREDLLPSREKAQELFRPLVAALQYGVEQLDLRKEYRQGGRFVSMDVQTGSVLDASELTREALKEGRERLPKGAYEWREGTAEIPGGAAPWPPEPLTTLIALYALAEEPLEPLVEALHPDPSRVDWESIEKCVVGKDGLRRRARQLAAEVCGWKLGQGRHPEETDREQHNAALYVTQRTQEGASYYEILHELRAAPGFLKELKKRREITLQDVERLGALRLTSPEH